MKIRNIRYSSLPKKHMQEIIQKIKRTTKIKDQEVLKKNT